MKRYLTIVILIIIIIVQYGYHRLIAEVSQVNFHSSVIRPSQMIALDLENCKDDKILRTKIAALSDSLGKSYRYSNGNTGLFCDVLNDISSIK